MYAGSCKFLATSIIQESQLRKNTLKKGIFSIIVFHSHSVLHEQFSDYFLLAEMHQNEAKA